MKEKRTVWSGVAAAIAMLLLILDAKTAYQGAHDGVVLCITTVIPSLFPFIVLASIVTNTFGGKQSVALRIIGRICRIPAGSETLLIAGLLGGYPVGAQCIANAYKNGQISEDDAQRMLGFCSNAGPAFIFGMTSTLFSRTSIPFILWAIHILSAIIVGTLLPGGSKKQYIYEQTEKSSPTPSILLHVRSMGTICAWIVIFRIIIAFCERWFLWAIPTETAVFLQGILELSNGCVSLQGVSVESVRFIICSSILGFGGICVYMQTLSVIGKLQSKFYFAGKLLQSGISCLLSIALTPLLFTRNGDQLFITELLLFSAISIICSVLIFKNSSGNMKKCVV